MKLIEMISKYYYEDAVDYLEDSGISCDPSDNIGEYVCDLLDSEGKYDREGELYYTKSILNSIIKKAKAYDVTKEDEDNTFIRRVSTPDLQTLRAISQGWEVKFNDRAILLIKKFLTINKDKFEDTFPRNGWMGKWFIRNDTITKLLEASDIYVTKVLPRSPLDKMFMTSGIYMVESLNIYSSSKDGKFISTLNLEKDKNLIKNFESISDYLSILHTFGYPLDEITEKDLIFIPWWFQAEDNNGRKITASTIKEAKEKFPQLLEQYNKAKREGTMKLYIKPKKLTVNESIDYNSYEDPQIAKKVELIEKQIKEIFEDAKSDLDIDEAYYELSGYLGELRQLYMFGDEEN